MSRRLPWFKFNPDAFLADTAPLSPNAMSILTRGIAVLWREAEGREHRNPLRAFRQLCRVQPAKWSAALAEVRGNPWLRIEIDGDDLILSSARLAELAEVRTVEREKKAKQRARPADVPRMSPGDKIRAEKSIPLRGTEHSTGGLAPSPSQRLGAAPASGRESVRPGVRPVELLGITLVETMNRHREARELAAVRSPPADCSHNEATQ